MELINYLIIFAEFYIQNVCLNKILYLQTKETLIRIKKKVNYKKLMNKIIHQHQIEF